MGVSLSDIKTPTSSKATRANAASALPLASSVSRSCKARQMVDLPEELGPLTRIAIGAQLLPLPKLLLIAVIAQRLAP
jgi:hypothetical protein